jgi:ribosomal protein L11 methyltransferase
MDYIAVNFTIRPKNINVNDILASILAENDFESFTEVPNGMTAYVSAANFREESLREFIPEVLFGSEIEYSNELIPSKNWNEVWEKNYFEPLVIADQCVIHSSFHTGYPKAPFDVVIDPKMAFGTGHHETTSLMIGYLLDLDLTHRSFLDMGCGTAVLAILASMKGANPVTGIDIDEWACQNALENIQLNHTPSINIKTGDASLLTDHHPVDVIFANINRNILLIDMAAYRAISVTGSSLYMSGFYEEDLLVIREEAIRLGFTYINHRIQNNWTAVRFDVL